MSERDETEEPKDERAEQIQARLFGDASEFLELLKDRESVVPLVLRFHLYLESILDRFISACIKRGDRVVRDGRLGFAQKLVLVHALDVLPDEVVASVRKLNKLRNELSHDKDRVVTYDDVRTIAEPLNLEFVRNSKLKDADLGPLTQNVFVTISNHALAAITNEESADYFDAE